MDRGDLPTSLRAAVLIFGLLTAGSGALLVFFASQGVSSLYGGFQVPEGEAAALSYAFVSLELREIALGLLIALFSFAGRQAVLALLLVRLSFDLGDLVSALASEGGERNAGGVALFLAIEAVLILLVLRAGRKTPEPG